MPASASEGSVARRGLVQSRAHYSDAGHISIVGSFIISTSYDRGSSTILRHIML